MAVLVGGALTARIAYNQADDNAADRLLGLQAQIGRFEDLVPDQGVILQSRIESELAELDVGVNVYDDGVTDGSNTLASASAPFNKTMLGMELMIYGHGTRVVESVTSASEIEFSGLGIAADTGVKFTRPVGWAFFDDGEIDGNVLKSASTPFSSSLVGRNVYLVDKGSREITVFTSTSEIEFDGGALPYQKLAHFLLPVPTIAAERSLSTSGGQIVDSHRVQELNTATIVRWRFGDRRRRGGQRTVV